MQDAALLGIGERGGGLDVERQVHLAVGGVDALTARTGGPREALGQFSGRDAQQATPTPVSSTDKDTQMSEPPANDETQAPPVGWAAGAATFTVGDRVFTVELTLCGMYGDGDDAEVVLAGPASENGGDATGFLEGDLLPAGSELNAEFRIDIGADGPQQSTDEFLALGLASGSPVTFSEEGGGYVVRSGAWNENGEDLGEGSLAFSCA